jgi:hypothetical protein
MATCWLFLKLNSSRGESKHKAKKVIIGESLLRNWEGNPLMTGPLAYQNPEPLRVRI